MQVDTCTHGKLGMVIKSCMPSSLSSPLVATPRLRIEYRLVCWTRPSRLQTASPLTKSHEVLMAPVAHASASSSRRRLVSRHSVRLQLFHGPELID